MRISRLFHLIIILASLFLVGCELLQKYERPIGTGPDGKRIGNPTSGNWR
jgi:hypothetical protein